MPDVRVVPAAPMTWRSAAQTPVDAPLASRVAAAPVVAATPLPDGNSVSRGQSAVHSAAAPAPIAELDPRVMDRLADDVIRRVERRARIERERRGV